MQLHHLALRTTDLERLVAFYRDVFGLAVLRQQPGHSVWLGLGADDPRGATGAVLMIERAAAGEPAIPPGSMEFVALAVDAAGRDRVRAAVAAAAINIEHETAHTTYLRDPDGRRVGVSTADLRSMC